MSPFNLAAINFVWLPILPMVVVTVAAMVGAAGWRAR